MFALLDHSLNTEIEIRHDVKRKKIYKFSVTINTIWINVKSKPIDAVELRFGRNCEGEGILSFRGLESLFASG
jgi:hypothetical protein